MCANIRRVWVSGFSHSIPTIFQCRQLFFLLSFWLKFKVHIMFWVKRLSPRYDYASSFMLLFSLLSLILLRNDDFLMYFCCVCAFNWNSLSRRRCRRHHFMFMSSVIFFSLIPPFYEREKKSFTRLLYVCAYVCVSLCECTFVVAFFLVRFKWKILSKQHWIPMLSLSVLKRYGKNECGNLKRIIEWIYVQ